MRKARWDSRSGPFGFGNVSRLELVAQCELHYARIGGKPCVLAERRAGEVHGGIDAERIETHGVQHVEDCPSQLQGVTFRIRHLPAFAEAHVEAEVAGAAQEITLSGFTGEGLAE